MAAHKRHFVVWIMLFLSAALHAAFIAITPYEKENLVSENTKQYTIKATLKLPDINVQPVDKHQEAETELVKTVTTEKTPDPVKKSSLKERVVQEKSKEKEKTSKEQRTVNVISEPVIEPIAKIDPVIEIEPVKETENDLNEKSLNEERLNGKTPDTQALVEEFDDTKETKNVILVAANKQAAMEVLNQQRAAAQASYLADLKKRIEENKRYPRIALKRRLEGSVDLNFQIDQAGNIIVLEVETGHRLFKLSAESAVKNALPFPPPEGIEVPIKVSLILAYQIQ